jgi:hypothetical protein
MREAKIILIFLSCSEEVNVKMSVCVYRCLLGSIVSGGKGFKERYKEGYKGGEDLKENLEVIDE